MGMPAVGALWGCGTGVVHMLGSERGPKDVVEAARGCAGGWWCCCRPGAGTGAAEGEGGEWGRKRKCCVRQMHTGDVLGGHRAWQARCCVLGVIEQ